VSAHRSVRLELVGRSLRFRWAPPSERHTARPTRSRFRILRIERVSPGEASLSLSSSDHCDCIVCGERFNTGAIVAWVDRRDSLHHLGPVVTDRLAPLYGSHRARSKIFRGLSPENDLRPAGETDRARSSDTLHRWAQSKLIDVPYPGVPGQP